MAVLKRPDGGRLQYQDIGVLNAPVLLMLHGWAMSGAAFEAQVDAFKEDYRVIAPDFRGHGRSSPLPSNGTIATLSEDIHALIQGLLPAPVIIVGWSMGAMVAWDVARRYGTGALSGLVTIDMTPSICNEGDWQLGMKGGHCAPQAQRAAQKLQADWDSYTRGIVKRILPKGAALETPLLQTLRAIALGCDAVSLARLWVDMVDQDLRSFLPELTIPALITYGAQSQLYPPETALWLGSALPNAQTAVFQHSGHAPHIEEAQAFNDQLGAFAATLLSEHQDKLGGLKCQ